MKSPAQIPEPKYRWVTKLAGGFLVVLWLGFCAVLAAAGYAQRDKIPALHAFVPTATASPVPTPHILAPVPVNGNSVMFEDFSSNARSWAAAFPGSKTEVVDGRLFLQSNIAGNLAVATNARPLLVLNGGKYYVQGDFTTDRATNAVYGMVFGFDRGTDSFYLFWIQPPLGAYGLSKHTPQKWEDLVTKNNAGSSMRPYPQPSTLSVYFDQGAIELFIDGNQVGSYSDQSPFLAGAYGFYLDTSGVRLVVDNVFTFSSYK